MAQRHRLIAIAIAVEDGIALSGIWTNTDQACITIGEASSSTKERDRWTLAEGRWRAEAAAAAGPSPSELRRIGWSRRRIAAMDGYHHIVR